jgi:hypothetical protein
MRYVGFDYTIDKMYEKVKLLHKQISKKSITLAKCNNYIEVLDDIKNRICKISSKYEDWIEGFSDIEISESYFEDITEEEIYEVVEEIENQLQLIALKFNIDLDEKVSSESDKQNVYFQNINAQAQFQTQKMSYTQIQEITNEFDRELNKPNPDKNKLVNILKRIAIPGATKALEKIVEIILSSL